MKYEEIIEKMEKEVVRGDCADEEAKILYDLAYGGHGEGYIVEIGTYNGKSSIFLGNGSKEANREKVITIDNFGSLMPDDLRTIIYNLKDYGVFENVILVVATSWEFVKMWNKPIRLLYIDGCHDFEVVLKDFFGFESYVVNGGKICLHDTRDEAMPFGPYRLFHEIIQANPNLYKWEEMKTKYGFTIITKL